MDEVVNRYKEALSALGERADAAALLSVLIQRDQVATALEKGTITPTIVQRLADLDHRLRQAAPQVPGADWDAWRQALSPPSDRWWWHLDEAQAKTEEKRDLPWVLLASVLMTVTLSLTVEIIRRVWGGGPDWLSVVSTVLSLILTGSPLTKRGRELAEWLFSSVPQLAPRYRGRVMLAMAAIGLIVVLAIRFLGLPALALYYYNNRGYNHLRAGELTQARFDFQQAVSINPDYAEAYYNLADAYVEVGDYDKARSLYNQALAADRMLDLAYNGLGYVLILQGEPKQAIPVLYTGLSLARDDTARAALWTNLGRAYLEAKKYHEAEAALVQALSLDPEETAAHCALALTAEALGLPAEEMVKHWEDCLRYADATTPRGQELAALARAHLLQLEEERR